MKKILIGLAAIGFAVAVTATATALAQDNPDPANPTTFPIKQPKELSWSFSGPFGTYDKEQLQRGLKVYKEVCSACHSLNMVAFRNLTDLGYSDAQVKAFAAQYQIQDGPNDNGEMFMRPGKPSDHFPAPFPNEEAAAAANGGAAPPDLSVMAKARGVKRGFPTFIFDFFTQYSEGGPDYVHSLLTGFHQTPPKGMDIPTGTYYNPYFMNAKSLHMPPPLSDGLVKFDDGAPATVNEYATDVAAFLMWAAEPHMEQRKEVGFRVMIFLLVFGAMVYLTKRRIWSNEVH